MWERFWGSYGNPCLHCALYITGMPWKVWRKPPRDGQLPHGKTHLHTHAHRHTVCCSHRWEVEVQPRSSDILTSFRHAVLLGLCAQPLHTHTTLQLWNHSMTLNLSTLASDHVCVWFKPHAGPDVYCRLMHKHTHAHSHTHRFSPHDSRVISPHD